MHYSKISDLPIIEEGEAQGEVAQVYTEVKRDLQSPFVHNIFKGLAVSPGALSAHWNFFRSYTQNISLPQSMISMIMYTVATSKDCQYCSVNNELICRTLGVDEGTLNALIKDLGSVSPLRIQAIIEFALKVSRDPQGLVAEDYERVREQGVTDEELVEVIFVASISNYTNTLTDALKIDVDTMVAEALGR